MKQRLEFKNELLTFRRTKIVATLGPSSTAPAILDALIEAGVDVFRMNFSHGTHESHRECFRLVKEAIARSGKHVGVFGDLCGPKIRVGFFPDGPIMLIEGTQVTLTVRKVPGTAQLIPCEYEHLAKDVKRGDIILMADGTRSVRVDAVEDTEISCTVIRGGELSDRKGINLPNVKISSPAFTAKDREDAALACELGVDYLALSFVQSAADIEELKQFLGTNCADIPIIAKIEKPEALENIGEILAISDALMIARGDLGVEMSAEEIPLIQKELTRMAIEANKPVIVATQMLESMIGMSTPTRAEVTDVAWAAMAGADAVMLSGETAVGRFPVEAVRTMDRVVRMIEAYQSQADRFLSLVTHEELAERGATMSTQIFEGLSRSAAQMARELNAKAMAVCSNTGETCRMVSTERPHAPILAMSTKPRICARMSLYWAVLPILVEEEVIRQPWVFLPAILRNTGIYKEKEKEAEAGYIVLVTVTDYNMALVPNIKLVVG
ncbi:MAG: pyruvate kinase [Proteobacteria bacterium]|nr:pyruvate kinase [Pseudomonadota bacterium]